MTRYSSLLRFSSRFLYIRRPVSTCTSIRKSSSSTLEADLQKSLLSRHPQIIHDYLSPTPSHLLNLSLADFLPPACHPSQYDPSNPHLPGRYDEIPLPQGHHLAYFSAQLPSSALLPDGTDTLHSPGAPFHRRLWGGGSLLFNTEKKYGLDIDGTRAVCIEKITDVKVKGKEGDEKVMVGLERRIGLIGSRLGDVAHNGFDEEWPLKMEERIEILEGVSGGEEMGGMDGLAIVERRQLVFLKPSNEELPVREGRILKPKNEPDYSVLLTPTSSLIFRFSALTFNAHKIHLDPQYCQEIEGYRSPLVHGPLSLTLMLSVLRSQLKLGEMVAKFDYRNLAPLFVDEEMRICLRKDRSGQNRWDVWIAGREGGYAVKGTAEVSLIDASRDDI